MARVTISYTFADGETIYVTASGKRSYPDAMAELRATAVRGLRDSLAELRALFPETVEADTEAEA